MSPAEMRLYTLYSNKPGMLSRLFNSNKNKYSKLTSIKDRYEFIKQNYPNAVSPIHRNFLELEKKLHDPELLIVMYDGRIAIFDGILEIEWSSEDGYWVDWSSGMHSDPSIKPKHLKDYIINYLMKLDLTELDCDEEEGEEYCVRLIHEFKRASWLDKRY